MHWHRYKLATEALKSAVCTYVCSVLQCVAVCCSVLQCVAVGITCVSVSVKRRDWRFKAACEARLLYVYYNTCTLCVQEHLYSRWRRMKRRRWRQGVMMYELYILGGTSAHCNTVRHTVEECNILQHTATYCNVLQRTATYCNTFILGG